STSAWLCRTSGARVRAARRLSSSVRVTRRSPPGAGAGGAAWPKAAGGAIGLDASARTASRMASERGVMALDLAEDVLRDQLFDVDRRLHLGQPPSGRHHLLRAPRVDLDELLADQPLGLHRDDGIRLELDPGVDLHGHPGLEVVEPDRLDPAHPDPGDLHAG